MNNQNVQSGFLNTIKDIGFCPQANYLPNYMTVKECLQMYAKLKGLSRRGNLVAEEMISTFNLDQQANSLIKNLR
jgi:ABC-type multidrug transport system ATPase subunit